MPKTIIVMEDQANDRVSFSVMVDADPNSAAITRASNGMLLALTVKRLFDTGALTALCRSVCVDQLQVPVQLVRGEVAAEAAPNNSSNETGPVSDSTNVIAIDRKA